MYLYIFDYEKDFMVLINKKKLKVYKYVINYDQYTYDFADSSININGLCNEQCSGKNPEKQKYSNRQRKY